MRSCSNGHKQAIFDTDNCPLCMIRNIATEAIEVFGEHDGGFYHALLNIVYIIENGDLPKDET